jgi:hypothetical protein
LALAYNKLFAHRLPALFFLQATKGPRAIGLSQYLPANKLVLPTDQTSFHFLTGQSGLLSSAWKANSEAKRSTFEQLTLFSRSVVTALHTSRY